MPESFVCPCCGSHCFGRDIGADLSLKKTVKCHGCYWRGVWPVVTAADMVDMLRSLRGRRIRGRTVASVILAVSGDVPEPYVTVYLEPCASDPDASPESRLLASVFNDRDSITARLDVSDPTRLEWLYDDEIAE